MKKLIALLLVAAPLFAFAQTQSITTLYKSYHDKAGMTTIMMGSEMLSSKIKPQGDKLQCSMYIIAAERSLKVSSTDINNLRGDVMKIVSGTGYQVLMDVKEDDEIVRIYAQAGTKPGMSKGVVILVIEKDEIVVLGIDGEFPSQYLKDISRMTNTHD